MFVPLLWIKEALMGLFRNFWWNAVAFIMSFVCLVAFVISFSAGTNAEYFSTLLNERLEVQIDVKEEVSEYSLINERISNDQRVESITFVSKDEAMKKMKEEMGEDSTVLEIFEENIFPAQFIVKMKNAEDIESFAAELEKEAFTDRVIYGKTYIERLLNFTDKFKQGGFYITAIGSVFVIFLVMFIIRMNVEQRKDEIRIKQLFGSSTLTVRMPFVIEALFVMLLASISTYYSFGYLYGELGEFLQREIPYISIIELIEMKENIVYPLFGLALGLGFFGSVLASNKHLKRIR